MNGNNMDVLMGSVIVENMKHIKYTIKYKEKTLTIRLRPQENATESLVMENLLLIRDTLVNKTNAIDAVKFWGQNNFVLIAFTFWNDAAIECFEYLSDQYVAKRFFNDSPEMSREFIEFIENTLGIRSFYENKHTEIRNRIKDIYYQSYRMEGIRNIDNCMKKHQTLVEMVNIMGIQEVLRISFQELAETTKEYIMYFAGLYTSRREKVTYSVVMREIFGKRIDVNVKRGPDINTYINRIKELIHPEYLRQCKTLVESNHYEIGIDKNKWKVFFTAGPGIVERTFDFSRIKACGIRTEVKHYMKNQLLQNWNYETTVLHLLTTGFNCLYEKNSSIVWCADISTSDIRGMILYLQHDVVSKKNEKKLSVSTIRDIVSACGQVVDFLILNREKLDLKSPVPANNCFAHVSFHNMDNMYKRTDIIPDKVADAIYSEIEYLNPRFRLMYKIFMNTGLRLKEVVYLTADCLEPTQYENVKYLRYIPYKVLSARRKRGLPDYKKIPVPQYIADEIQQRIEESKGLREEYQSQYIFINKAKGCTAVLSKGRNFTAAVNRLISKYGIKDDAGSLWNFSSRQLRKTLVSEMIENGATTTEVAYWLGHMSERTTREYYEEIKRMKLADLNAEFFSREFDVVMKKEHTEKFSPEEKRALYIDFKLNYRRVELGYCMKHYSESPCSYLSGRTKCAVCPNLCTGSKYLEEWVGLLNSQKRIVKELERLYASKNIGDYTDFKEYRMETYLLNIYQNVVDMIEKEGMYKK